MGSSRIKDMKPQANSHFKQGYYQAVNPEKYASLDKRIIYRSSLELKFFKMCDFDKKIVKWASEPFSVRYYHPVKKKQYSYTIDVWFQDNKGLKYMVEIKPFAYLKKPIKPSQNAHMNSWKRYKYEMERFIEIMAKKDAAAKFAMANDMKYIFITEMFFVNNGIK